MSITVGYQNKELALQSKQLVGVPFQNVTGGEIDIQTIVPQNNGADIGEGEAMLWWFDPVTFKYVYAYWTEDLYEDDGTEEGKELGYAGWCEDTDTLFVTQQTFAAGQAFWVKPSDYHKKPTVTIAGQVVSSTAENVAMPLVQQSKQLVCNPFPVDVDIQEVIPMDNGKDVGEGESMLWWFDPSEFKYVYAYWTEDLYEDDGTEEGKELGVAGWCEDTDTLFVTKKTLKAGEGFWVKPSDYHKVPQLTFPNALLTK